MKFVYTITMIKHREIWSRIGVAFENSDGSLNVRLNALPIDGQMHIRDAQKKAPPDSDPFNGHEAEDYYDASG